MSVSSGRPSSCQTKASSQRATSVRGSRRAAEGETSSEATWRETTRTFLSISGGISGFSNCQIQDDQKDKLDEKWIKSILICSVFICFISLPINTIQNINVLFPAFFSCNKRKDVVDGPFYIHCMDISWCHPGTDRLLQLCPFSYVNLYPTLIYSTQPKWTSSPRENKQRQIRPSNIIICSVYQDSFWNRNRAEISVV